MKLAPSGTGGFCVLQMAMKRTTSRHSHSVRSSHKNGCRGERIYATNKWTEICRNPSDATRQSTTVPQLRPNEFRERQSANRDDWRATLAPAATCPTHARSVEPPPPTACQQGVKLQTDSIMQAFFRTVSKSILTKRDLSSSLHVLELHSVRPLF